MMAVDEALNIAVIHTLSIKHGIAVSEAAEAASILAAEVRRLRDEVNGLTGSLDRAEKALKEAQEQPAVAWMIHEYQGTGEKRLQFQPHIPSIRDDVTGPIVTALYARPVPAAPAVAVPEMTDDALKEMLNAAQIVGYDDPLRIVRGFAMRVLQEWGNQEGMHKAFLDAVNPAVAVPAVPTDEQIHAAYRKALGQSIRERDMPEIRKFSHSLLQSALQPSCWCRQCNPSPQTMIVCPTCGNKRCPHANDHRNPCTGSNEPGQPGSAYPTTGDK